MFAPAALNIDLRLAHFDDVPALRHLVAQSVRGLLNRDYTPRQINSSLNYLFGVDERLIADGTYYVAESNGVIAGAGGWSRRKALYGYHHWTPDDATIEEPYLDPAIDAARIRAFFVHPDHARRGIARELLHLSESAARAEGFWKVELIATLTGIPLYESCGYIGVNEESLTLPDGVTINGLHMMKILY
jgi:GNAT superfamily N-acetyltransferase